jgi:endoglucanase
MKRALSCLFLWFVATSIYAQAFPLSTKGRWIVDADSNRVRLKSVNWYGINLENEVVAGLDKNDLTAIVALIKSWGFNSIRLPFSNQMLHRASPVANQLVSANPQLFGKTPLEVMDAVVSALTDAGLLVILNNHSTTSEWCCNYDNNGLWYREGDYSMSTSQWEEDWIQLVRRYEGNPRVVGADLRNEVRTMKWKGSILPEIPNWGKGDKKDWHKASEDLGRKILDVNPNLLIVVEAINWEGMVPIIGSGNRPFLRLVPENPVNFQLANKLVYAVHSYGFIGPRHNGDDATSKGQLRYSDMNEGALRKLWQEEWAFVLESQKFYTAPVWMSEFGIGQSLPDEGNQRWFHSLSRFLSENEIGFAYWPLNDEAYGLVDSSWTKKLDQDWRSPDLKLLLREDPIVRVDDARSFTSLDIRRSDDNQSRNNQDWLAGANKGTCSESARLVGISRDQRALCVANDRSTGGDSRVVAVAESSSAQGYDWALASTKYECPKGFVAAGVSKHFWGTSGLLCRQSEAADHKSCEVLSVEGGDQRLSISAGDFAIGSYKAQCRDDQYLGGIAQKNGVLQKVLCCSYE